MLENVHWIPLIPLIVAVVVLLWGEDSADSKLPRLSIAAMGWCLIQSTAVFYQALTGRVALPYYATIPWFDLGPAQLTAGVLIDGAAAAMLFVVSLVSFLVHVYSLGYMHGDKRLKRFYAYLGFFSAAMLGLVVASNLMLMFACWELVGLASYLLIGFWFERKDPAYAGKKAFITTKLGDLGFFVGLLLLYANTGTFDLTMLADRARMGGVFFPEWLATAVGLLLLCGAAGKSAQGPLFIWLPDAMEGPTPVSALIHAATMVAAGVYLVARTYFIYALSPLAMSVVAWMGLGTAFLAATMALVPYDIKRVLAFSTVSQLGYMMLGLGVGGYTAGLFHLTTHAFFKALLFLGAGSVIHAAHTNDMRLMGGLSKKMPATFLTMAIATLAISGFPFLSGWYSKEAILHAVYLVDPLMWGVALLTAGLTTFYMFRLMFMTFLGKSRDHQRWDHAHESPAVMTWPLWLLAGLSLASGLLLEHEGLFESLVHFESLAPLPGRGAAGAAVEGAAHAPPVWLGLAALAVFAAGAYLASQFYGPEDHGPAKAVRARLAPAVALLERRYFFDDFFLACVALADKAAAALVWFDSRVIDAVFVDGWGSLTRLVAEAGRFFDDFFVDGAVDGVGAVTQDAGGAVRRFFMAGRIQEYLLYVAVAVALFSIVVRMH